MIAAENSFQQEVHGFFQDMAGFDARIVIELQGIFVEFTRFNCELWNSLQVKTKQLNFINIFSLTFQQQRKSSHQ